MKVGQIVMLLAREEDQGNGPFWPPVGAVGEITAGLDADGDYEVFFPDHIWAPHDPPWYVIKQWLMPLDPPDLCRSAAETSMEGLSAAHG